MQKARKSYLAPSKVESTLISKAIKLHLEICKKYQQGYCPKYGKTNPTTEKDTRLPS